MKKIVTASLLVMLFNTSYAQNTRLSEHNTIGWFSTTITPKLSSKISAHIEYIGRRDNLIKDWQQSLLRVGVNFKVHPQVTLHAGYGYIDTYPYGTYSLAAIPKRFPEHRIYEQVVVNGTVAKINIMHRLRLEQRWLGRFTSINSNKPDSYVYLNRLRYMTRIDVPIKKKFYAAAYDEIFIGFGKNVNENIFDQNRLGLMVGYKANNTFRLESGFINQIVQLGREINGRNVFQYNSGVIVNSYINF